MKIKAPFRITCTKIAGKQYARRRIYQVRAHNSERILQSMVFRIVHGLGWRLNHMYLGDRMFVDDGRGNPVMAPLAWNTRRASEHADGGSR